MERRPLELYLHIPFCMRKCRYCDFLSAPAEEAVRERYVQALIREIGAVPEADRPYRVETIFFGGGTPSILTGEQIGRVMEALRRRFLLDPDAEISLEANPGTLDPEKLEACRAAGINRLSLGLQSADDRELKRLGRLHDYGTFRETYRMAREAGFDNINVDLMSSLPGQLEESWERSLRLAAELGPEHLSAYSLIIEEGTPFYEEYGEDELRREAGEKPVFLPSEEQERRMYQRTKEVLREYGYERYEISNYAKPGRACRHNEGYWTGVEYLGLGLGASSYIEETRFSNRRDLEGYLEICGAEDGPAVERLREEICRLTRTEREEEFFFLGLRRMAGVRRSDYRARFGEDWGKYRDPMTRLIRQGFLKETPEGIALTEAGIDVSNAVFAELLA